MFLYKVHLSNTKKCTFCNSCDETLLHLFWECSFTHKFRIDMHVQLMGKIYKLGKKEYMFWHTKSQFQNVKHTYFKCKILCLQLQVP